MAGTNINETNSRCEVNKSDSIPLGRCFLSRKKPGESIGTIPDEGKRSRG